MPQLSVVKVVQILPASLVARTSQVPGSPIFPGAILPGTRSSPAAKIPTASVAMPVEATIRETGDDR